MLDIKIIFKEWLSGHVNLFEMFWRLIIPETQGFDPQSQHSGFFFSMFDKYWKKLISQKTAFKNPEFVPKYPAMFDRKEKKQTCTHISVFHVHSTLTRFPPEPPNWPLAQEKSQTNLVWFQTRSSSLGSQSWPGEIDINHRQDMFTYLHTPTHIHVQSGVFPPKHETHPPHHTQSNLSTFPPKLPGEPITSFNQGLLCPWGGANQSSLQGS